MAVQLAMFAYNATLLNGNLTQEQHQLGLSFAL